MKKERRFKKEQLMVYFIAFIMISSVFGVIFFGFSGDSSTTREYGEFSFLKGEDTNSRWFTEIGGKRIYFDYFPTEVENINISPDMESRLSNTLEIDLTSEVNDTKKELIAFFAYDLQEQLNNKNIYVRLGFTTESEFNVPIISCDDATMMVPVLYLKESNETKIYSQGQCIIVEAKSDFDFVRIKDRIAYSIHGIME